MKDLTDFAVIARSASTKLSNLGEAVLRVVPLGNAPTLTEALGGLSGVAYNANQNMTLEANSSISESNIHSVQDRSNGYVRVVARINGSTLPEGVTSPEGYPSPLKTALGFALLKGTVEGVGENAIVTGWEVLAVASLKEGCNITDGCYVAFTFSKTNNYQSVSFSPNAFATIEDLDKINGLDGLHIAFDHASGDIKLLDKDGNVLDQANLHMDADTIIADGEEGYKYVKTDVQQDIHAEKAFMPAGKTAGVDVEAVEYSVQKACFLVDVTTEQEAVATAQADVKTKQEVVADAQKGVADAQKGVIANPGSQEHQETLKMAQTNLSERQNDLATAQNTLSEKQNALASLLSSKAVREGTSPDVCGIRACGASDSTHKDYIIGGSYTNPTIGATNKPFLVEGTPDGTLESVYSPDAFVWTVSAPDIVKKGDPDAGSNNENVGKVRVVEGDTKTYRDLTFADKMNVNAQALGFHVGDDIPLGTNIATLIGNMSASDGFDAEKYMHEGDDSDYIDELVDAQRANAKDELVAWNAQHPALLHDGLSGTRISSDGVDIRHGKIEIGNGIPNEGEDSVKRYVIETDIGVVGDVARADTGLQIGVMDSGNGLNGPEPIQRDILTINAEDYISGAPTCLALLKCHKDSKGLTADLTETQTVENVEEKVNVGRITANFTASGMEDASDGVFTLTITDNRANNGFGDAPRIVEIIPVYKSGADATEAVPAQRSISAIETAKVVENKSTLSIRCSQVIDWAQSIDLDPVNSDGNPVPNGMELYLIVKVY